MLKKRSPTGDHQLEMMRDKKKFLIFPFMYRRAQAAWEKLNHLEDVKFKLSLDIEDKSETIRIDKGNLELDDICANISYKPRTSITEKTE